MSTITSAVISFNISSAAKKFCDNHITDNKVSAHEVVSHDDYDDDGPKSYLYDLFVVTKRWQTYSYYYYHRENWFAGTPEEQTYYLEEMFESNIFMEIKNLDDFYAFLYSN